MNVRFCFLLALALLGATPIFAAKPPKATPAPEVPSALLRHLMDMTLSKIGNITDDKQPPLDRTAIMVAKAEYSAKVQTAPPAQQPMYQAALNVIALLVSAVEEHEKGVADFHYSKNVHGKQDREDAKVAIWQRGSDAGAAGRADNAKQKMENEASRKALLDKEKFMSNGTAAIWTQRVGQIHDAVEQSLTTELVAEQQYAMLAPPAPQPIPPPPPAPKPARKPKETSAADQYSPVGEWKAVNHGYRSATLKEDNTVIGAHGNKNWTGTWKWTDQSKGALTIAWSDGLKEDVNFSADGRSLSGKSSNGNEANFTRSKEAAPDAPTASTAPPAIAEIRLSADPTKGLSVQRGKAAVMSPAQASKIKIQPGLVDPSLVSLQLVGVKGFYLRHQNAIVYLHERPQQNALFEADASFKLVHLDGDKVRFEASNFPGTYLTAKDDGSVVVLRDAPPAQSTFILKAQ